MLDSWQRIQNLATFARRKRRSALRRNKARGLKKALLYGGLGAGLLGAGLYAATRPKKGNRSGSSSGGRSGASHTQRLSDISQLRIMANEAITGKPTSKRGWDKSLMTKEGFERALNDPNHVWRF